MAYKIVVEYSFFKVYTTAADMKLSVSTPTARLNVPMILCPVREGRDESTRRKVVP